MDNARLAIQWVAPPLNQGADFVARVRVVVDAVTQLEQPDAQSVVPRRTALDKAVFDQRRQDAESSGGVQAGEIGQGLEADRIIIRGDGVQQPGRPGNCLLYTSRCV